MSILDVRLERKALLDRRLRRCHACPGMNVRGVTDAVPAFGNVLSPVVILGQSPCVSSAEKGIPFSGEAGGKLDKVFLRAGVKKADLFILNATNCHPEGNRKATEEETENCRPYVMEYVKLVKPKLIVCLGSDAQAVIFGRTFRASQPVVSLWPGFKVAALGVYHPAYFLHQHDKEQEEEWADTLAAVIRRYWRKRG